MQVLRKAAPLWGLAALTSLTFSAAQPAVAAGAYYTTDATINYALNGAAIIGTDANGNMSSPNVRLVPGGSVNGMYVYGGSKVSISGGQVNDTPGALTFRCANTSTVTLSSGSVKGIMNIGDSGALFITGGSVSQPITADQSSRVTISGGSFSRGVYSSHFYDSTAGSFTFVGSGLGATATGSDGSGGQYYALTGTLMDGTSLNGNVIDVASGATMFTLVAAPEPSQAAVLGLGALVLAGTGLRKRQGRRF